MYVPALLGRPIKGKIAVYAAASAAVKLHSTPSAVLLHVCVLIRSQFVADMTHRNVLHSQPKWLQQLRQRLLLHHSLAVPHLRQPVCNALLPLSLFLLACLPPPLSFADVRRRLQAALSSQKYTIN